jgi:hypothetical protein
VPGVPAAAKAHHSSIFGGEVVTSRYFHCKAVLFTLDQLGKPKMHTGTEEAETIAGLAILNYVITIL